MRGKKRKENINTPNSLLATVKDIIYLNNKREGFFRVKFKFQTCFKSRTYYAHTMSFQAQQQQKKKKKRKILIKQINLTID